MRILYVTSGFPYPLTSGYLRAHHLIRGLSARHTVDLLSTVGGDFSAEHVDGMRPWATRIETVRSTARSSKWRKAMRRVGDAIVRDGSNAAGRALARAAGRMLADSRYDVILLGGRWSTSILEIRGGVPVVIDLCDAVTMRLTEQLRYAPLAERILLRSKLRRVRAAEERLVDSGAPLLFASIRDRDVLLGRRPADRAAILPNGVDLEFWHRSAPRLGDEVVFSGAMHYPPNDDAANVLLRSIMPRVWAARPEVRLRIIGRDPTRRLRAAAATDPRVQLTGFVDDVRPHLDAGGVYVAPLRFASGIQNKLLEALSMEVPVITSPVAAAGLQSDEDVHPPLTVATSAEEFAPAILQALDRVQRDPEPHRAGRAFVAERFTWARAVDILERVLDAARQEA
jgi:polysaccharide biosynthesis protein PslH